MTKNDKSTIFTLDTKLPDCKLSTELQQRIQITVTNGVGYDFRSMHSMYDSATDLQATLERMEIQVANPQLIKEKMQYHAGYPISGVIIKNHPRASERL